jgi:hypothetical protein
LDPLSAVAAKHGAVRRESTGGKAGRPEERVPGGHLAKGVASPEMQQVLNNMNAIPVGDSPAQLDAFVRSEVARWSSVAKKANIKLD